jgi:hypothetical protein
MNRTVVLCLALLAGISVSLRAQSVDPYARLTDPFALARLNNSDFAPLSGTWGFGISTIVDSQYPDYRVAAYDTGAGFITHLFATYRIHHASAIKDAKVP